jgi:hypothetical protein
MRNPVFRFRRHIAAHLTECDQLQISAQALLVKRHCLTTISVKDQVCIDFFHDSLRYLVLVLMKNEIL